MLERDHDVRGFEVCCDTVECGESDFLCNVDDWDEAETELQRLGWTKMGRNWFCPQCDAPPRQVR